jgi:hypothetical protein
LPGSAAGRERSRLGERCGHAAARYLDVVANYDFSNTPAHCCSRRETARRLAPGRRRQLRMMVDAPFCHRQPDRRLPADWHPDVIDRARRGDAAWGGLSIETNGMEFIGATALIADRQRSA